MAIYFLCDYINLWVFLVSMIVRVKNESLDEDQFTMPECLFQRSTKHGDSFLCGVITVLHLLKGVRSNL